MITTKRFIRINQDGTSEYVVEQAEPKNVADTLIEQMSANRQTVLREVFALGETICNITWNKSDMLVVATLRSLSITSCLEIGKDKLLHPAFVAKDDARAKEMPTANVKWEVPNDMRLVFASRIIDHASPSRTTYPDAANYLFAYDGSKRCWRLPLPNLYEDGAICMGKFEGSGKSIQEAFAKAYSQFVNSQWNSDLYSEDKQKQSDKLLSFKPTNTDVEQVPFSGDWTKHCYKIATPITDQVGGAL